MLQRSRQLAICLRNSEPCEECGPAPQIVFAMKGQKLFVRQLSPADHDAIERLDPGHPPIDGGFLGKLLGEPVAYALTTPRGKGRLSIDWLFVVGPLRRKRAGMSLVHEIGVIALLEGRSALVVRKECEAAAFFKRLSFVEVEDVLIKRL